HHHHHRRHKPVDEVNLEPTSGVTTTTTDPETHSYPHHVSYSPLTNYTYIRQKLTMAKAPLNLRNSRVLELVLDLLEIFDLDKLLTLSGCTSLSNTEGCDSGRADTTTDLLSKVEFNVQELAKSMEKLKKPVEIVPPMKKNGGNDRNDGNDGNGGGGGDEKKKEEDEGNGGGKMKYPAGQSGFGQFSCGKVYRHGYGYQNGALKTGEKMLLLCCEFFGLLVNHLARDIYSNVMILLSHLYTTSLYHLMWQLRWIATSIKIM
ncbi:unnamed protein product, partial [Prunus brigantina]